MTMTPLFFCLSNKTPGYLFWLFQVCPFATYTTVKTDSFPFSKRAKKSILTVIKKKHTQNKITPPREDVKILDQEKNSFHRKTSRTKGKKK